MKRLTTFIASLCLSLAVALPVTAEHFWQIKMSEPASLINRRTFNLEFTTLSVEETDDITVKAYQDGSLIGTETTTKAFGDSGAFEVTVPGDGTYVYHLEAASSLEAGTVSASSASVTVDTVAPGAPSYGGKVRDGNKYTLTFTAPSSGDVVTIRIYSSTSPSFTANASTQIGVMNVDPGETVTFTYTASDDAERFHAIQAFDAAGNFSTLRNDPGATVVQGTPSTDGGSGGGSGVGGAATGGTAGNNGNGAVAGAEDKDNDGKVDGGAATTDGDVLGAEDKAKDAAKTNDWLVPLLIILAILGAAYYWLYYRKGIINPFKREEE